MNISSMSASEPDAPDSIPSPSEEASELFCPNCGSAAIDKYCAACGQQLGSLHIPVRAFVADALKRMFALDSRTWQTLFRLICRPGLLTLHYLEGKRARYIAPMRLYLIISFVTFLILALTPDSGGMQVESSDADSTTEAVNPQENESSPISTEGDSGEVTDDGDPGSGSIQDFFQPALDNPERMRRLVIERLAWVYFFVMPVFACVLQLFYRKREAYYVPHLIFTLHVYTASFLMYAVGLGLDALLKIEIFAAISLLGMLCHLFLSLRRVYGEGRMLTVVKVFCLLIVHSIAVLIGMGNVLLFSLGTA